ncbi:hypothetical protein AAY473_030972 [Plecturocebus cupreus]
MAISAILAESLAPSSAEQLAQQATGYSGLAPAELLPRHTSAKITLQHRLASEATSESSLCLVSEATSESLLCDLALGQWLECNGMISAHCNLRLPEMWCHHVGHAGLEFLMQAGLEYLTSGDLPTSASQNAGLIDTGRVPAEKPHGSPARLFWPVRLFCRRPVRRFPVRSIRDRRARLVPSPQGKQQLEALHSKHSEPGKVRL